MGTRVTSDSRWPDLPYDCCRPFLTYCTAPSRPPTRWHLFWVHRVQIRWQYRVRNLRRVRRLPYKSRPRGWWYWWLSLDYRNPILFSAVEFPKIKGTFPELLAEEICSVQPMTGALDGLIFPFEIRTKKEEK